MLINYNGESKVIKRICELLNTMSNVNFEVVAELPTVDISTSTIYLVPKSTAGQDNIYDEYINTDGTSAGWELIGDTEVDLSNYYTKAETDALIPTDFVPKSTGGTFEDNIKVEKTNTGTSNVNSVLIAGNNKAVGTLGNSRGALQLHDQNGKFTNLFPSDNANNLTYYLPKDKPNNSVLAIVGEAVDWASNGILGAKNRLPFPYYQMNGTVRSIPYSAQADGGYRFNGTNNSSTNRAYIYMNSQTFSDALRIGGKYIVSFSGTGTGLDKIYLRVTKNVNGTRTSFSGDIALGEDKELEFVDDGNTRYDLEFAILPSATVDCYVYPLVRLAEDKDNTYRPYAMTNKELTDEKIGKWQDLGNWNTTSVGSSMSYSDKYDEFLIRIVGTTYSLDVHILNIAGVITGASGRIYRNYYQSDSQNYMAVNVGLTFGIDTIIFALETGTEEVINGSSQSIQQIRTFAR